MTFVLPTSETVIVAGVLLSTLKLTFDALAELYGRKDGPWVDELKQAALHSAGAQSSRGRDEVEHLFAEFREQLRPGDWGSSP